MSLPSSFAAIAVAALLVSTTVHAGPGELTLISVVSMKDSLGSALVDFEKDTGQPVVMLFVNPSQLKARIHADHPDVVVASEDVIEALARDGGMNASSRAAIGRVGVGLAVGRDAKSPDVKSAASFKQALVDAKSLILPDPDDNPDGAKARASLAQMGLVDTLKARTQYGSGSNPLAPVGFGNVELGLHSMHQIVASPDLRLVGPVPAEWQQWTRYELALVDDPPNPSEAQKLVRYLGGDAFKSRLAKRGFDAAQ